MYVHKLKLHTYIKFNEFSSETTVFYQNFYFFIFLENFLFVFEEKTKNQNKNFENNVFKIF